MPWAAIDGFRKWTTKRKGLLKGLLGLTVEGVAECVPGGGLAVWATRVVGEFAKHGVERLADTSADVPDLKPAGQSITAEQLEQLNDWLASLSTSYAGLLNRLDALVTLRGDEPEEQLQAQIRSALAQHAELASKFDAQAEETRRQTLALARIEVGIGKIYLEQKGMVRSLQEIKVLLLRLAPPPDWIPSISVGKKPESPPKEPTTEPTGRVSSEIVNSIRTRLVLIPAGDFLMGSPPSEPDRHLPEGPQHRVTISHSFYFYCIFGLERL